MALGSPNFGAGHCTPSRLWRWRHSDTLTLMFKRFHREIISELERKTDMDVKYMTATFKRYQIEHKMKQESLERSQSDLKKLRRKSQGKNANKYENKESEVVGVDNAVPFLPPLGCSSFHPVAQSANACLETLTSRQMDIQLFIADGCKEALLEEKRRFCFLVDKHCIFSYQYASFHEKVRYRARSDRLSPSHLCKALFMVGLVWL
ncbi:Brain-specific angiogenesis inhibitor 1-associated protein 2-like protein 1 [Liparis tanakae]|uniref:Brain-specific angiogenesis inhibitor 1-associated protein 2-like protein 1 n=1 Tax=Liparis tanakae TaxID=230148 RepID=A0A4Z2HU66_9TELE|nr:Brain-specific angiogenesis inhibitor 1-associated protein 2-like protein 1 [Liparis tanakae]